MKTPKALRHHNDKVGRGNSSGLIKVRDGKKKKKHYKKDKYLASSTYFSKLFCITLSNNLNLLNRASVFSDVLSADFALASRELTSSPFLCGSFSFSCLLTESFGAAATPSFVFFFLFNGGWPGPSIIRPNASLVFRYVFASARQMYGESAGPQHRGSLLLFTHAQHWSLLFRLLQLSLLLKLLVACTRGGQHGYYHRNRRLLVPLTSILQMATETLLYHLGLNDHRLSGGPKAARSVRTPGDPARRRQLLRL